MKKYAFFLSYIFHKSTHPQKLKSIETLSVFVLLQRVLVLGYASRRLIKLPYLIPRGQRNRVNSLHISLSFSKTVVHSSV